MLFNVESDEREETCSKIWVQIQIMVLLSNPILHLQGVYTSLQISFLSYLYCGLEKKENKIMLKLWLLQYRNDEAWTPISLVCPQQICPMWYIAPYVIAYLAPFTGSWNDTTRRLGVGEDVQFSLLLRRDLSGDQEEKWWIRMKAGSLLLQHV